MKRHLKNYKIMIIIT